MLFAPLPPPPPYRTVPPLHPFSTTTSYATILPLAKLRDRSTITTLRYCCYHVFCAVLTDLCLSPPHTHTSLSIIASNLVRNPSPPSVKHRMTQRSLLHPETEKSCCFVGHCHFHSGPKWVLTGFGGCFTLGLFVKRRLVRGMRCLVCTCTSADTRVWMLFAVPVPYFFLADQRLARLHVCHE